MILYYVQVIDVFYLIVFFFFKQKTAYEMRISDWSSDVCSSDLLTSLSAAVRYRGCYHPAYLGFAYPRIEQSDRCRCARTPGHHSLPSLLHGEGWLRARCIPDHLCSDSVFRTQLLGRSVEPTFELQSLMRISYADFCLKQKTTNIIT